MKHVLQVLIFFLVLFTQIDLFAQNIEQGSNQYEVSISPNPVEDRATIKINQGHFNLTAIKIYDLIGKVVYSIEINNGNGSYPLDLSGLRPGVYFCTIFSEKGAIETRKLVRSNK